MRKIIMICIALLALCVQGHAQKYINVYQEDIVIKRLPVSEVDSISLTETEPVTINLWYNGDIIYSRLSIEVDSIKIIDEGGDPFSYIGVVGFNNKLYRKVTGVIADNTKPLFDTFINELPCEDGSVLYYAVDNALDMLENANIKTPYSSINLITFTDGLDQGSIMLRPNYMSSKDYLDYLVGRIKNAEINGVALDAYTVGLRGQDVSDADLFKKNITSFASSDANAFEVHNMSELHASLQDIANRIISINSRQTISVRVPGSDNGTKFRFVFDNESAENSQLYIEGVFNINDNTLHDVIYHGIKARSGNVVQGTKDGIFVTFTFRGMRLESGTGLIPTDDVKHFYMSPSTSIWQKNSEFKPSNDIQKSVNYSGTSIVLVLDCSSSLGNDFSEMQRYAKEFVNMVSTNAMPFNIEAPKNVVASLEDDEFAINVSWEKAKNATVYNVYRCQYPNSQYTLVADSLTDTSWKDMSPMGGDNYYKVRALGYGSSGPDSECSNKVNCSLSAPSNGKAELAVNEEDLVAKISWDTVKYAEYYKVYRYKYNSRNTYNKNYELIGDSITSTSWFDSTLSSGQYEYKIYAFGHGMTSPESSVLSLNYSYSAPTNVNASIDDEELVVNVSWDAVDLAQCYQVYRSNSNGYYASFTLVADSVTSATWKDMTPLSGNNYYKIRTLGYGLYSSDSNVSPGVNCSLSTPSNVQAVHDDNDLVVNVSWDKVDLAECYKVYRSNSNNRNANFTLVADSVFSTSWSDQSPLNGNNFYRIVASSHGINSNNSNTTDNVNISLATPSNVRTEHILNGNKIVVNVLWDKVQYAEYYQVYRKKEDGSGYEMMADGVTSTSWTDESPLTGENNYLVYAYSHGITSSDGNVSNNYTLSAPNGIIVQKALDNEKLVVQLSWESVQFAECYQIHRSGDNDSYILMADSVKTNTWIDESPLSGINYYKINALGHDLIGDVSNAYELDYSISAPASVSSSLDDTEFAVNVSWDNVEFAQYYNVYRSNSNSTYTLIADSITTNTWKDTSPNAGKNYYKVSALGYGMASSQSNTSNEVNCSLSQPTNVTASHDDTELAVNVSWDAVKYAECYNVYRSSNYWASNYTLVADSVPTNTWRDMSPNAGDNYYKVSALGHGMTSSQSNRTDNTYCSLSQPSNVNAELIENDNKLLIKVSWDAVQYAKYYKVYRSNSSYYYANYTLVADSITSTSWIDNTPLSGMNYYKVYAFTGNITSSESSNTSGLSFSLSAPSNVKASLALNNNSLVANVTWDVSKAAKYYKLYRSSDNSNYSVLADSITTTSWMDEAPSEGSNYYKVSAFTGDNTSSASNPSNNLVFPLPAPSNVKAALDNEVFAINVSWDNVELAQYYNVYRSSQYDSGYTLIADSLNTNSWVDSSPMVGYNYYKIRALGYGFEGADSYRSNEVYCYLSEPTNIKTVHDDTELAVNVSWNAVKYAECYNVYRSSSSYSNYTLVADSVPFNSWQDQTPLNGNNYYKVSALGHGMTSSQSDRSNNTDCSLSAPENVQAELIMNEAKLVINVSWDVVKYTKYYKVYRKLSGNSSSYEMVADSVTTTSWIDNNPLNEDNYYKIYAFTGNCTSPASNASNGLNYSLAAPSDVKGELVLNNDNLVINLTWNKVQWAESYKVYRCNSSNGEFKLLTDTITTNSWVDKTPLVGSNYYKIVAYGYGVSSQDSPDSYFVRCGLKAPENVMTELLANGEKLAVNISWDAVQFAESYRVYRSNVNSGEFTLLAENIETTTWKDESLLEGDNYYKVCAVGHGLVGDNSSVSSKISNSLNVPTELKGELMVTDDKLVVNLTWVAPQFAQSYKVYRSNSASGEFTMIAENVITTSWNDESALEGDNYYKVCAMGYGLTSDLSAVSDKISYLIVKPTEVKGELMVTDDKLVVNLTWVAPQFAQSYKVYRSNSASGEFTMIAENVTTTSWNDESAMEGDNYYKVCAVGYGLTSDLSAVSDAVVYTLNAPTQLSGELMVSNNQISVSLSWIASQFAQSYKVYRSNSATGEFTMIAENVATSSWIDESALEGSNYYKVCAVGYGLTSIQSEVSAEIVRILNAPTNVHAEHVLSGNKQIANLTWDPVQFAESYKVYRSETRDGEYTLLKENITSTEWSDESPAESNNYYKICAVGYGLTSVLSAPSNVVALGAPQYSELQYIERNSSYKGKFENIGVVLKDNTKFVIKVKPTNGGGGAILGEYNAPSDYDDYRFFWHDGHIYYDYGSGGPYGRRKYTSLSVNQTYELEIGNYYIKYLDGSDILRGETLSGVATSHTRNICLFGDSDYAQIYYLKVYEGNTLIKDFIPVRTKDTNTVTLYDKVSGTFLDASGTFKGADE